MEDKYFNYFAYENPMKNKALLADIDRMLVYLYKRGCYFCVCMSLYIKQEHGLAIGKRLGLHLLAHCKTYKGHHAKPVMTCQSVFCEHMQSMERGKGLTHEERMLIVMLLAM